MIVPCCWRLTCPPAGAAGVAAGVVAAGVVGVVAAGVVAGVLAGVVGAGVAGALRDPVAQRFMLE
jgi:hypothetical protein